MGDNGLSVLIALSHRYFPGRPVTGRSMAEALFLEQDFWRKMGVAVANGIALAFKA